MDIDKDSSTDLLLVGAPLFMGAEKEEQGKVYVYALNQVTGAGLRGTRTVSSVLLISKRGRGARFPLTLEKGAERVSGPTPTSVSKRTFRVLTQTFKPLGLFCFENVNYSF